MKNRIRKMLKHHPSLMTHDSSPLSLMKEKMANILKFYLILLSCISMAGCGFFIAGAATGAGVYSYANGELSRSYQISYNDALAAGIRAMEKLDLKITETDRMALSTVIRSEYYNGKPVTVRINRSGVNITEISVRSGIIGVWDKNFSEKIHAAIQEELQ